MPEQPDPVADMLKGVKTSDAVRASAWDAFYEATSEDDLAKRLQKLPLAPTVKADLWDLKVRQAPTSEVPTNSDNLQLTTPAKSERTWGDTAADLAIGAAKGLGNTVYGLGKMVYQTPIGRISDAIQPGAFDEANKPPEIIPTNTPQKVGYGAEQIGEFFVPAAKAGAVGKVAGKALTAGKDAALTLAQSGSPVAAGVSGALAAAIPGAGVASKLAGKLEAGAEKKIVQALGPTKERFKAIAERRAREIISRGLGGSREQLKAHAEDMVEQFGQQIDDALTAYGQRQIPLKPVVDALEQSKQAFQVTAKNGATVTFEPRAVRQLEGLQDVITKLGTDATAEQLVAIRRAWDKVVSDAGGFAHRAGGAIGVPLKDQSEAWAKREATGAIRKLLDVEVPELSALNKEFAFWKDIDSVLTQTLQRTQPQGKGVGRMIAQGAGQAVGAAAGSGGGPSGTVGGAVVAGKVAEMARALFTSPRWQFVDAKMRSTLADALASGSVGRIQSTLANITASLPSQARQAMAQ
jgi:hypothetical protein